MEDRKMCYIQLYWNELHYLSFMDDEISFESQV